MELVSPCSLVGDVAELFREHGHSDEGFQAVGDRLRRFARQADLANVLPSSAASGTRVLTETIDGSLALTLTRLTPADAEPLPAHSSWSISCVVRGRARYVTWTQPEPQAAHHPAGRRVAREIELTPGDFIYFPEPPVGQHGRLALGRDVWELRLTGQALKPAPIIPADATDSSRAVADPVRAG